MNARKNGGIKHTAIENLIENVDSQIIKIRTKSLDVSFNELYDMYKKNADFQFVIKRVAADKIRTRYDQELVLRFFAIKNDIDNYKYPVTEYLTRYLEKITEGNVIFDFEEEKKIFEKTFEFIKEYLGVEAFSGRTSSGTIRNEFVLYYFDGITVSIGNLIEKITECDCVQKIVETINEIKYGPELQSYKTGSINGVKTRIRLFTEGVEKVLDGR